MIGLILIALVLLLLMVVLVSNPSAALSAMLLLGLTAVLWSAT